VQEQIVARRYFVSGRVQGVGFRNYVQDLADRLNLQGYVRNRRDGTVEVFAMGTSERLKKLRLALERGPLMSNVTNVMEQPSAADASCSGSFTIENTE
jgi:acylphosphatase